MQSVPITTKVVSSIPVQGVLDNIISSFRDLLQVSGFIGIPVSFTINHHLIGKILLQVMLSTNLSSDFKLIMILCVYIFSGGC